MSDNFPKDAFVVIIDGTQGRLYRNRSGDGGLKLEHTGDIAPKELANDGPAGGVPKDTSPREKDEATFAKQVAEYLYQQAQEGSYADLILVADPQTLGQMRPSLHKEVTERLFKEIGKTLTKSSVAEIERSIKAA